MFIFSYVVDYFFPNFKYKIFASTLNFNCFAGKLREERRKVGSFEIETRLAKILRIKLKNLP